MSEQRLFSRERARVVQIVTSGLVGLLALGTLAALATYPSWQLGVAVVCLLAVVPLVWVLFGSQLAPLADGVSAGRYLRSAGLAVAALALIGLAAWMFSLAPTV